jgi:hypothetical protein
MGKFEGIFDDVVVNAKAAASVVSKKASVFYDTSKHKISAAEIRSEINKKLRELGTYTYKTQVHGTDCSAEIEKTVSEIKDLKDTLEVILAHIDEIKNQKKCPNCGAKIAKNAVFCHICGVNISDAEEVEPEPEAVSDSEEAPAEAEKPAEPAADFAEPEYSDEAQAE